MLEVRPANERGCADRGWLRTYHSFSFADYHDRAHMGFGPLRVINEDYVQPGQGFPQHGHRDMEIITYVLAGQLEHKDSMGNGSIIHAGEVQRMSAGSGVLHSESNPSDRELVHLLQIWIRPEETGVPSGYEQRAYTVEEKRGRLRLIASRDGAGGSVSIHQDARVYASILTGDDDLQLPLAAGRLGYVQVAAGDLTVNGVSLHPGDGLKLAEVPAIVLNGAVNAEVLVFDLPAA